MTNRLRISTTKSSRQWGFTLIELLVVVSIIGMLSSVSLASLSVSREKAIGARSVQDLRTLKTGFDIFHLNHNRYPCGLSWSGDPYPYRSYASSINNWVSLGIVNSYCNSALTPVSTGIMSAMPAPASNDYKYLYLYEARNDLTKGPQQYILYTHVDNPSLTEGDGGLCSKLYEVGNAVGIMAPVAGLSTGYITCN